MSHIKKTSNTYKRQPSGNSGRKGNQPKDRSKDKVSRAMDISNGQINLGQAQTHSQFETTIAGVESSQMGDENIDSYDPARISQWAAHSATGPPAMMDPEAQEHCNLSYGNNIMAAGMVPQMPNHLSVSQSGSFHALPSPACNLPYHPGIPFHGSSATSSGAQFSSLQVDNELPSGPGFGFPLAFDGSAYNNGLSNIDDQTYSAFASGDLVSFSPIEADPSMLLGNNNNGLPLPSSWDTSGTDITQPLDWSPASGLTPSSSSMQSAHGFLGHPPDIQVSPSILYDGMFAANQNGPLDGENGAIPPFNLGEATATQSSMSYTDPESTIRPTQNFRRDPIPMDMWAGCDGASQPYGFPVAYNGVDGSRRSSEGEVKSARDHAFYKAMPKEDGLYHCPYTTSEKCTHKPDKLKCNYDKHLDSHLKPYRCKSYGCSQIQFSSTACLLRHEREAHGMHGHGPKPHLCFFKDCDRAQEDNGFPRRWNLFDHMKRVHDFAGTEPSNKSNSPSPSSPSSEVPADVPKKRRTPSPTTEGANKRAKIANADRSIEYNHSVQPMGQPGSPHMVPEYQSQSLNQIWYDHIAQVQARLHSLDPTDPRQWKQYQADTQTLQTIGLSIQFQQQAQLAH